MTKQDTSKEQRNRERFLANVEENYLEEGKKSVKDGQTYWRKRTLLDQSTVRMEQLLPLIIKFNQYDL